MKAPCCKTCGSPIKKATVSYRVKAPVEGKEAGERIFLAGTPGEYRTPEPAVEARPDGTRIQTTRFGVDLYLANPPRTKAEAQRLVNGEIVSVSRSYDGTTIGGFGVWEGDFEDEHFCTNGCAERFGRAFARAGATLPRRIPKK